MKRIQTYRYYCKILAGILAFVLTLHSAVTGQVNPANYEYPHHHLPWFTIEGEHFLVHYQHGNSQSAQFTIAIADDIYSTITGFYGYEPAKKVSIVLRDREDYSNGAAFFFDDKIEIWVPAMDTPFRGTHHWLRNVITHEFIHIVQLGSSMKRTQRIPAIYFQWLSYEDIRRPDVLYGFPNALITYPIASVSIPAWFAEGSAQYQSRSLQNDFWDTHRDMILRTRILTDSQLSLYEMNHFNSKNSLERELVYNQGYNFVLYLTDRFGDQILPDLSNESASSGLSNFDSVIKKVTGIDANKLYSEWIEKRKNEYQTIANKINSTQSNLIRNEGFLNFYPQKHLISGTFAFISNQNRDYSRTSLIIKNEDDDEINDIILDTHQGVFAFDKIQNYQLNHGFESNISLEYISNRFSFSPDGTSIAYSRADKNRYGEIYQDLYIYDTHEDSKIRLTHSARIQDPDWHPFEQLLVAVQLIDGTQNLVIVDIDSGIISPITQFKNSETLYTPIWAPDGNSIYFSIATTGKRDIAQFNIHTNQLNYVLSSPDVDFRDPMIPELIPTQTQSLYFSSDISGIFNIYRYHFQTHRIEQITDVLGGAFMPFMHSDTLFFSEYKWDGYKLAQLGHERGEFKQNSSSDWADYLNNEFKYYHDLIENDPFAYQIGPLPFSEWEQTEATEINIDGKNKIWRPYTETSTGLSILPVIRFDNYTKLRGSNSELLKSGHIGKLGENLWRDLKIGATFSSRDVTERLNLFAGALFGPGSVESESLSGWISPSRINKLDRDLFFIADYQGIPFIKKGWSPTISIEIFNLKRNVKDGLSIEEFQCTSCLPIDKSIDIRYSMWEANLFLRSKLNRWSLLELGASYSPYSVAIENFYSEEFQQLIPGSNSEYYKGSRFSLSYITDLTLPDRHVDIAPRGSRSSLTYRFEPGRLLQKFEVNDGLLSPVYSKDLNHSIELKNRTGFKVSGSSNILITSRFFSYLNKPDDYFYLDYIGGLDGMRSYPYFAMGGQLTYFSRASFLFPIYNGLNKQFHSATFDKVYAHLFFEAGNGWGGPLGIGNKLKTGIGSEIRLAFNSYYLFPMKFFINSTYGLNRYSVTLPSQFITTSGNNRVDYGREFLFYLGLTFDFDL